MDSSVVPPRRKVADRIRVFQDVQQLQTRIPSFQLPPRVLTQDQDSIVSPPSRASSDESEHVRGDGVASVAEILYQDFRDLEKLVDQEDQRHHLPFRPFTSMDGPGDERGLSRPGTERQASLQFGRRNRSMENVAEDPALEIAMARSRLRSIAAPKQQPAQEGPGTSRSRPLTMDELNTMLDDAIKSNSPKPEVSSDEQVGNLAPKPGFVLRRASTRQDRRRSQSRARVFRRTTESVEPRTSDDSTRVRYDGDETAPSQEDAARRDTVKVTSPATPQLKPVANPITEPSPVKQRAAIFESLTKKAEPSGHESNCRHFGHDHDPTHDHTHHHPGPTRKEPKKVHRIKFGDRIEERPATPLIPLNLPTMVTKEKTPRSLPPVKREEEVQHSGEPPTEEPDHDDVFKEETQDRKPSLTWPFKWGIFSKGASAPPQESDSSTPTLTEPKSDHHPTMRPSVVRSKVQQILQAAEEKDDAEQRRREAERERITRRNSRAAPPSRRQTVVQRVEPKQETITEPAPMETPKREQLQGLKNAAEPDTKTRTPLQRAMSEKQVFAPPVRPEQDSDSGASPQKSLPQTPVRGRPSLAYQTPEQKHSVERQFNLSPTRRASKQRQGVKVEVEIRDSPEREARERGEKIVIIRAGVGSDMDEGK
ncbi:hypothetical protein A1O7_06974 [Cladophialophora yegresii CBS 114405]|uniref:Uncharacterized protein n=1 Tax=Cladophialophora yegresii CBS 114405 TaxID=1182544 RepID=W9VUD0_9EURO|nr:uncharacterized protein A1O7_06974 [Cladophialophora yegresii CBS 114405]EXJ56630.1 hypothetical protein A1O7_06974 [Cladophialophora yegresii CBS 114405]